MVFALTVHLMTGLFAALCAVFDQADITRDGTISIAEYMALCEEYGVALDDEDIQEIKDLADQDGEIHKVNFILHIKNSRLLKHFETVDPYSRIHWKKKADLAFRHSLKTNIFKLPHHHFHFILNFILFIIIDFRIN